MRGPLLFFFCMPPHPTHKKHLFPAKKCFCFFLGIFPIVLEIIVANFSFKFLYFSFFFSVFFFVGCLRRFSEMIGSRLAIMIERLTIFQPISRSPWASYHCWIRPDPQAIGTFPFSRWVCAVLQPKTLEVPYLALPIPCHPMRLFSTKCAAESLRKYLLFLLNKTTS